MIKGEVYASGLEGLDDEEEEEAQNERIEQSTAKALEFIANHDISEIDF
ncbi:MAG: hypothetical protein LBB13_02070 [Rickettsiales bacterium]|jgi:hypothetical protein|nr:hypothetical protein [Rickettsiales bacterium]